MAIGFVAIVVLLDATPPPARRTSLLDPLRALRHRAIRHTALIALFHNFGFFTLLAYTPFPLHTGAHDLGLVFFGWGLALALSSALLAPVLKRRFGTSRTLGAALAGVAAILVAMAAGESSPEVLVAGVIVAGGFLGVVNYQLVMDALRMWPRSSAATSRGLTTSRRCCLSAPSTSAGTSSSV